MITTPWTEFFYEYLLEDEQELSVGEMLTVPRPAGPAHFWRRFGPPFLSPEGSSTLKLWRRRHSQKREPFAPGGHPQAGERGGRSPEGDQPPRRKNPQVEKKEDTVGRVTMINGAMSSTLIG
jgi:hypothetical protein